MTPVLTASSTRYNDGAEGHHRQESGTNTFRPAGSKTTSVPSNERKRKSPFSNEQGASKQPKQFENREIPVIDLTRDEDTPEPPQTTIPRKNGQPDFRAAVYAVDLSSDDPQTRWNGHEASTSEAAQKSRVEIGPHPETNIAQSTAGVWRLPSLPKRWETNREVLHCGVPRFIDRENGLSTWIDPRLKHLSPLPRGWNPVYVDNDHIFFVDRNSFSTPFHPSTKPCDFTLLPPSVSKYPSSYSHTSLPWFQSDQSEAGEPQSQIDLASERKPPSSSSEPSLSKEQQDLVNLIMSGKNVFYTGSAGVGKSTVLKAFVKRLKDKWKHVDIIAPTGRAALDINGSTTWTYAGWTPVTIKKPLQKLKENAQFGKFVKKRLDRTDVLVIDEISMVENHFFERLNAIMKAARGNDDPFGGVQLVVTGDFCQLPPVKPFGVCIVCGKVTTPAKTSNKYKCTTWNCNKWFDDEDKWAFRSKAWEECGFDHVNLTKIHRQSEEHFIKILNKCRYGIPLTTADTELLLDHPSETEHATQLFSTREEVRRVNQAAFDKLTSEKRSYRCLDRFDQKAHHPHLAWKSGRDTDGSLIALRDHRFDSFVELKEGMLVVLLVNLSLEEGLVNGSQGVIVGFEEHDEAKLPKLKQRDEGRGRENLPASDFGIAGDYATLREMQVREFINGASKKEWPIVKFSNGAQRTIYADCTVNEEGDDEPYSILSRTQIPLLAGWAMTIHKAQGMTLDRVIVDLSKSFEEGQVYVALSRARSLGGLKVEGLPRSAMTGNEQVKGFLREKFGIQC